MKALVKTANFHGKTDGDLPVLAVGCPAAQNALFHKIKIFSGKEDMQAQDFLYVGKQ
jgi:hypothetical protein